MVVLRLARFAELHALGYPLLAGLSRKSFLTRPLAAAHPLARSHAIEVRPFVTE